MPKIMEQKKPSKGQPVKQEAVKPTLTKHPEEKKVTVSVFRVFECQMYLEDASRRLSQIGIFPGPEAVAEARQTKLKQAQQAVNDLLKDYKNLWMEMQAQ